MLQTTAIIRDRYQFTVPEALRENLSWIYPGAVTQIIIEKNAFVVRPYRAVSTINWEEAFKVFDLVAKSGKQTSLSEFVIEDRKRH